MTARVLLCLASLGLMLAVPTQLVDAQPPRTTTAGGLTAEQIRSGIRANISQVQRCYERGLADAPTLAGRVTVAFIIGRRGRVMSSAVAESTLVPATTNVPECIAAAVRGWRFPRPDPAGEVSVRFPFNLSQSGGE